MQETLNWSNEDVIMKTISKFKVTEGLSTSIKGLGSHKDAIFSSAVGNKIFHFLKIPKTILEYFSSRSAYCNLLHNNPRVSNRWRNCKMCGEFPCLQILHPFISVEAACPCVLPKHLKVLAGDFSSYGASAIENNGEYFIMYLEGIKHKAQS